MAAPLSALVLIAVAGALFPLLAQSGPDVAIFARALQPGEVIRIQIACACAEAPRATAFGRDVPLARTATRSAWEGLVGIDVDAAPGEYPLTVEITREWSMPVQTIPLAVSSKQFRTRNLRVASQFVDPDPELLQRITREATRLEEVFGTMTSRAWTDPFTLPVDGRPSSNFGSRSVFNGEPRSPHAGVDFSSRAGTIISAPAAGTVALAEDLFFTGNTVIIDHGGGVHSLFAHLSSMAVAVGTTVAAGANIGRVGATGRATGPHLHWSVRLNGARVDPLSLIAATEARQPMLTDSGAPAAASLDDSRSQVPPDTAQ